MASKLLSLLALGESSSALVSDVMPCWSLSSGVTTGSVREWWRKSHVSDTLTA